MFADSHCHLNMIDLAEFNNSLDCIIQKAYENDVRHFLSVCVEPEDYPQLCKIADRYKNVHISVGVHPNHELTKELDSVELSRLALLHPSCVAIGETGLDYYRVEDEDAQEAQRQRFREHIRAAIKTSKPLIIHTRQAAEDTLKVLEEENAAQIGGVMHCFSESWSIAERAIDLNFYISMSGIVTFKNAVLLQDVAKKLPLDRLLIETDSPYLAPVPFRGKQNHPALVKHVAIAVSELRQIPLEALAIQTTENYKRCFRLP